MMASVVSKRPLIDAAFCDALRVTLVRQPPDDAGFHQVGVFTGGDALQVQLGRPSGRMPESRYLDRFRCIVDPVDDAIWRVDDLPQRLKIELWYDPPDSRVLFEFAQSCDQRMPDALCGWWIVLRDIPDDLREVTLRDQ